jgi:hypothetical protein
MSSSSPSAAAGDDHTAAEIAGSGRRSASSAPPGTRRFPRQCRQQTGDRAAAGDWLFTCKRRGRPRRYLPVIHRCGNLRTAREGCSSAQALLGRLPPPTCRMRCTRARCDRPPRPRDPLLVDRAGFGASPASTG